MPAIHDTMPVNHEVLESRPCMLAYAVAEAKRMCRPGMRDRAACENTRAYTWHARQRLRMIDGARATHLSSSVVIRLSVVIAYAYSCIIRYGYGICVRRRIRVMTIRPYALPSRSYVVRHTRHLGHSCVWRWVDRHGCMQERVYGGCMADQDAARISS